MSEKNVKTTETKPQKKDKNAKPNFFGRQTDGRSFGRSFVLYGDRYVAQSRVV